MLLFSQICQSSALFLIAIALAGILMLMCRANKDIKCMGCQVVSYVILFIALFGLVFNGFIKIYLWKQVDMSLSCPMIKVEMPNKISDENILKR